MPIEGPVLESGCILIKDGKIARIAPEIPRPHTSDLEVLDAQGGWVLPGLLDIHCHIGITEEKKGKEGDDCNEMTNPITPHLRAIDAINPMDPAFRNAVRAGITGVMTGPGSSNVVGGQWAFIKTAGRVLDEMIVKAPAAMKVAFGENPKTNYKGNGIMPTTRMSIAAMLRQELSRALAYREQKQQAASDFQEDFQLECWLPVLEGQIPLKAHVHRADDILTAIRIAREFGLKMTLDHCTEGHLVAEEIYQAGCPAIVGPTLASRNKIEVQNLDFKTPGLLRKVGVSVAICTDHPVSVIQCLPHCAGFAAHEGMGIEEALRAITLAPARIAGVDHRLGSLVVGKDADIAIFNGNPMEVFTTTLYTIIDGKVVYRLGEEGE